MSVSARDPDHHSVLSAMRNQIRVTEMPAPRRLPRVRRGPVRRSLADPGRGSDCRRGGDRCALLAVGAATTAPAAFAVTDNQDGSVTITLNEITGVSGLNAKLASMGIAVRAVPVVSGCDATGAGRRTRRQPPAREHVGRHSASEQPQDGEPSHVEGDHGQSSRYAWPDRGSWPHPPPASISSARSCKGRFRAAWPPVGPNAGRELRPSACGESTIQLGSH